MKEKFCNFYFSVTLFSAVLSSINYQFKGKKGKILRNIFSPVAQFPKGL